MYGYDKLIYHTIIMYQNIDFNIMDESEMLLKSIYLFSLLNSHEYKYIFESLFFFMISNIRSCDEYNIKLIQI